jgi:hypothetical protein
MGGREECCTDLTRAKGPAANSSSKNARTSCIADQTKFKAESGRLQQYVVDTERNAIQGGIRPEAACSSLQRPEHSTSQTQSLIHTSCMASRLLPGAEATSAVHSDRGSSDTWVQTERRDQRG